MRRIVPGAGTTWKGTFTAGLLLLSVMAIGGCATWGAEWSPRGPAFVDRKIDGYLMHLGREEAVNRACQAQAPLLAPALKGVGVRFLGCALLARGEAYSIQDPGVIAHELCHLRLRTGSHVLCPPPKREGNEPASLPTASAGTGASGLGNSL